MAFVLELEDLPDVLEGTLETKAIEVTEKRSPALVAREEIARLEDKILQEASTAVLDGLMYAKLPVDAEAPLPEWIEELGKEKAWDRFRAARFNQMNNKEAPVGTKHAVLVHTGITRARAAEKGRPVSLNVGKVYLTLPAQQFPEQEIEGES
jgi:hypothetical protein